MLQIKLITDDELNPENIEGCVNDTLKNLRATQPKSSIIDIKYAITSKDDNIIREVLIIYELPNK